ncbi:MAG: S8 family serine peptidase, partial [Pyrinomonadaceae bacterium]
ERTVQLVINKERSAAVEAPAQRDLPAATCGEVLVRFRPGTTADAIRRLAARLNDRLEDRFEYVWGYAVMADRDCADPEALVAEYARQPEVEYAEPSMLIEIDPREKNLAGGPDSLSLSVLEGPNDPLLGEQWALVNTGQREGKLKADINALLAWSRQTGSDEVVVAVLDSGVNYMHPDLINNMWLRPATLAPYRDEHLGTIDDERGYNAVENDGNPMDENGHGTHCAGIIGAEGNNGEGIAGVNWKVQIMPLKFMGAGGFGTTKDAVEAINYVIARKKEGVNVRVISASWGSTRYSKALEEAVRRAGDEGILFVAAAGNASVNTDRSPHYPSSYQLPNVLAVAALNRRDEMASFSNFGPKSVHVAAPGAEILSTWLGVDYEEHSGTSMATPVVSGVAALVLAADSAMSVKELRERLLKSVDPLDALQGKVSSGGRINAARAVGAAASAAGSF